VPLSTKRKAVILVVEDDFLTRAGAADMVRDLGFDTIEAEDADQAVLVLERTENIAIVFTDIQMPGSMDGLRLIALVRDRWPPVALLVTSGHQAPRANDMPSGTRFLPKPYLIHQLKTHLDVLTGGRAA
jgi:CheY-like chemotaxis protein